MSCENIDEQGLIRCKNCGSTDIEHYLDDSYKCLDCSTMFEEYVQGIGKRNYFDLVVKYFPRLNDKLNDMPEELYSELARAARQIAGIPDPTDIPYTKVYGAGCSADVYPEREANTENFTVTLSLIADDVFIGDSLPEDICNYIGNLLLADSIAVGSVSEAGVTLHHGDAPIYLIAPGVNTLATGIGSVSYEASFIDYPSVEETVTNARRLAYDLNCRMFVDVQSDNLLDSTVCALAEVAFLDLNTVSVTVKDIVISD